MSRTMQIIGYRGRLIVILNGDEWTPDEKQALGGILNPDLGDVALWPPADVEVEFVPVDGAGE